MSPIRVIRRRTAKPVGGVGNDPIWTHAHLRQRATASYIPGHALFLPTFIVNLGPGPAEGSAARALARWANSQDEWVRLVTHKVLVQRTPLDNETLDACYDQMLAEKELIAVKPDRIGMIAVAEASDTEAPSTRLLSISNTKHVNRLTDDQKLDFNPRMTVIYGENASGKTGYVRVLKAVAGSRSTEPVLPDIYRPTTTAPSATIEFLLGVEKARLEWFDGVTIPAPLHHLSVFDAPAAPLHVDDDLSYSYTPSEITLFEITHTALSEIRDRLITDRNERKPKGNPYISRFQRGTRAYRLIETLRATTKVDELRELAAVEDNEIQQVQRLRDQVRALADNNYNVQLPAARSARTQCDWGRAVIEALLGFDGHSYEGALTAVADSRAHMNRVTKELFTADSIPGLFTDEWRTFVRAADEYVIRHFCDNISSRPNTCPYCAQLLAADAQDLLYRYKTYLTNQAQVDVSRTTRALSEICRPIKQLASLSKYEERVPSSVGSEPSWVAGLDRVGEVLERQQHRITNGMSWDLSNAVVDQLQLIQIILDNQWQTSDELVKNLSTESKDREYRLTTAREKLSELEDQLTLRSLLPAIEEHLEAARWADHASSVARIFQGLLRGLTEATKAATSQILNSNFEAAFQRECSLLSCPNVRLKFPGRQGTTRRHKTVGTEHRLGKVLSEGEQKVIALADFLAEVSLRPSSAPIIFDDPITSLDSRRTDEVANRLVKLSRHHQVIVFTHHLYFASKLFAAFEATELRQHCSYHQVLTEDDSVGLVRRGDHPRTDTIRSVRGRINKVLQDARAASGSVRDDLIATVYGHLRTWIEVFVEDHLLQGAVKRHRASISIDALIRVDGVGLDRATAALRPIYERACRRIWPHSQTYDQLQSRPTIGEVESDWEQLREIASQVTS